VIRFDDADGLRGLLEREGMTVVSSATEPGRVTVLARTGT
jgi:hypothetical protein